MVRLTTLLIACMLAGSFLQAQDSVLIRPAHIEQRDITTALVHSTIRAEPELAIGKRGFCYSQKAGPTLANDHIEAGRGAGDFKGELTGLKNLRCIMCVLS